MSRKCKKSSKGIIGGIIAVLATILVVGGLGALTNGYRDWNFDNIRNIIQGEKDNRVGLVKIDLTTEKNGSQLNMTSIISYLNERVEEPIFKEVLESSEENLKNVFLDNGGLKFGKSSEVGSFTITLVESYQFNRVKLIGRNYSSYVSNSATYSCDECAVKVNGSEKQTFATNASDNTKIAPTEEKLFKFDSMQKQLKIEGEEVNGKRFTLFAIEMWSELDDHIETSSQTSSSTSSSEI